MQIIAVADQPEEDLSNPACTPIITPGSTNLALNHVRRIDVVGHGIPPIHFLLQGGTPHFQFIDYLTQACRFQGTRWQVCERLDGPEFSVPAAVCGAQETGFEVHTMLDGHVRIKSLHFDRFWRRSPNWIWADANGTHADTLFWPVKIDDNTIALRNAGNNNFIVTLRIDGKTDCLNAQVPNMTLDTRFEVEELVLKREIYHVRYRMEESRIYDEEPSIAGTATAGNFLVGNTITGGKTRRR
ncbi:uncharacterized protein LOC131021299 [Salvia miltiorrhiza]|uniref:uncharacterized protein LOC131021299 n=1 Tax=Salvia miltiorrhiza TaxID=226208 RepID=UPI0025AD5366|nr:uncharacterized protein LOC131021299 [Salvia miltiorrhiza]